MPINGCSVVENAKICFQSVRKISNALNQLGSVLTVSKAKHTQ